MNFPVLLYFVVEDFLRHLLDRWDSSIVLIDKKEATCKRGRGLLVLLFEKFVSSV